MENNHRKAFSLHALPCMFGTGLLQTAGGRLLLSSFHKRDRTLPEHTQINHQSKKMKLTLLAIDKLIHKHAETKVKVGIYLLYFFYSSELHSPFALREKEGQC